MTFLKIKNKFMNVMGPHHIALVACQREENSLAIIV